MVLPSLLFQERSFNLCIFLNSKPTPCDFLSSLGFFPYTICGLSKGHTCFFFPEGRIKVVEATPTIASICMWIIYYPNLQRKHPTVVV